MILLIANKQDITTDIIINKLNKRNIPYYRLNTEDLFKYIQIRFDFINNKYELIDSEGNVLLNLDDVKSVYFRRPELPAISTTDLSPDERHFILNEACFTLEGIYKLLADKHWLNSVYSIREAENKIYQLFLAKKLGFEIPNSIITSDEIDARNFISFNNNDCIVKPIRSGQVCVCQSGNASNGRLKVQHLSTCPFAVDWLSNYA
jgi:hypothetical protein